MPRATRITLLSAAGLTFSLMAAPLAAASPAGRQHEAGLPAAAAAAAASAPPEATCAGQPAPWMNTRLSPGQRASLLVAQMTVAQETQMTAAISTATQSREVPPIPSLCIPALLLTNGSAGISTGAPVQDPATALPAPISLAFDLGSCGRRPVWRGPGKRGPGSGTQRRRRPRHQPGPGTDQRPHV